MKGQYEKSSRIRRCSCGHVYKMDGTTKIGESDLGSFYNCPVCRSTGFMKLDSPKANNHNLGGWGRLGVMLLASLLISGCGLIERDLSANSQGGSADCLYESQSANGTQLSYCRLNNMDCYLAESDKGVSLSCR